MFHLYLMFILSYNYAIELDLVCYFYILIHCCIFILFFVYLINTLQVDLKCSFDFLKVHHY